MLPIGMSQALIEFRSRLPTRVAGPALLNNGSAGLPLVPTAAQRFAQTVAVGARLLPGNAHL